MFGVEGVHVLDATRRDDGTLVLEVETDQVLAGCVSCGVVAVGHGRRVVRLHDSPCFGRPVLVRWRKRVWRCAEAACPVSTWTEEHGFAGKRSKLTARAICWAADALRHDDTTVSAIARHLGVDWHTAWAAIKVEATRRVNTRGRLSGVRTLGVDEHIWRPSMRATNKAVTIMVDLTRDDSGCLHARLLDAVEGRSGAVYADWLKTEGLEVTATVEHAALDPFRGYANAIRDELPEAVAVLDAFHVVKLGSTALDEVRRRVQQETLGRRGLKDDPLYRIRRTLMTGTEHLTSKQKSRLEQHLPLGDPNGEVHLAWQAYQRLRAIYHATTATGGHRLAEHVIATFHTCPIPEIARLGRTLRAWRDQILAYFATDGVNNGGTEAINGVIEKTRRLAHGFRNFTNYRLRILLAADGTRPYRRTPNHA
ncbi:transposase [Kribbella orskensis]|uniref:Transposase n=2 Tax=Kribbella orskensis TaxID=2512216 RepID=A0ABY2B5G4_9ACTN|nr:MULTISPECIES: ISL3 family transposase [Kribbella]TCN25342.1 transposase [Kribbella sp. VKM Ac-2500]TCO06997.1 transposase [Kribbella orskensis]